MIEMYYDFKVRHYGSSDFHPEMFERVIDSRFNNKPLRGGFWTSPLNSRKPWREVCVAEGYEKELNKHADFLFNGKVLVVDSEHDVEWLPRTVEWLPRINGNNISFETLDKVYDALHLTVNGEACTRHNVFNLWDCETFLIFNPDSITQIGSSRGLAS